MGVADGGDGAMDDGEPRELSGDEEGAFDVDVGIDKAGEDEGEGVAAAEPRGESGDSAVMDRIFPSSMVTSAGYMFCLTMSTNLPMICICTN